MRLKNLFIAIFCLASTAIFAIEGTIKVINPQQNICVVVDSGNGNVVPGETISVLNRPVDLKPNDVLIVKFMEVGPVNNRRTVAVVVGLQ